MHYNAPGKKACGNPMKKGKGRKSVGKPSKRRAAQSGSTRTTKIQTTKRWQ
jgi:hypothetical protein